MVLGFLKENGQVSIEFILIVTIALIYINASVWPSVENSSNAAMDVKAIADTKVSAMKLANAVNEAGTSSGDMRKTVNIFIPKDGKITIAKGATKIDYDVLISYMNNYNPMEKIDGVGCELEEDLALNPLGFRCTSSVDILASAATNLSLPTDPNPFEIEGPRFGQLVVEKTGTAISVDWKI